MSASLLETNARASADDLTTAVARMGRVGTCYAPSFSPDGTRLAFVSDLNGVPQVWTVSAEGGWPELVTALTDQVGGVLWSPTEDWLAFTVAPGGGLNSQIYLIRPDGTGQRRLTEGGKDNNWLAGWTHDGKALMLASSRRTPNAMDGYLAAVPDGPLRLVVQSEGIGNIEDVSRNGKFAVFYRMLNRGDSNLFLVNIETGEETLLTPHEGPGAFNGGKFSPDGKVIYLTSNKDQQLQALARVVLSESGQPGEIEVLAGREDAEAQGVALSEDGSIIALIWNVAGKCELNFYDVATGWLSPGPMLPAELVSGMTFSRDGKRLAMTVSGSASPADIWVGNRETNVLTQVTHSPHPGIKLESLIRPELVKFPAHDGLELSGWLYRPQSLSGTGPIVLSFHGGPEGQERPFFSALYQSLIGQGISILAPNVRGSSGFGKTFVNLDNGALRVNAIRDIKACVDYIVGAGIADPKRIGIMGGSYGGYMTMAGLTEYPDFFAAGANLFGVVNFETFFRETEPWMAAISKIEYGDPDTEAEMLRSLSPIHKIDRVRAATLVLHGANDTNVPVIEAEQVVDSLKQRGVPVEYVLFPDEGHGFRKTANRIRSDVSIVQWFAKYL